MLAIETSTRFKKSYNKAIKRGYPIEELNTVIKLLSEEKTLPIEYKDHSLSGNLAGYRECHIRPNWLLIYKIGKVLQVLYLYDTGTHSDLFNK